MVDYADCAGDTCQHWTVPGDVVVVVVVDIGVDDAIAYVIVASLVPQRSAEVHTTKGW